MSALNLEDFNVMFQDGGLVYLLHKETGKIVEANLEDVADFYDLIDVAEEPRNDVTLQKNSTCMYKWSEDQTKFLLNLYKKYMLNVGPQKKFKNMKTMWNFIAKTMSEKFSNALTPMQAETRIKNLIRRVKQGAITKKNAYYNDLRYILSVRESIISDFRESLIIDREAKAKNQTAISNTFQNTKTPKETKSRTSVQERETILYTSQNTKTSKSIKLRTPEPKTIIEKVTDKILERKQKWHNEKQKVYCKWVEKKELNAQKRHAEKMKFLKEKNMIEAQILNILINENKIQI